MNDDGSNVFSFFDGTLEAPEPVTAPTGPWTAVGWVVFAVVLLCSPAFVLAAWGWLL